MQEKLAIFTEFPFFHDGSPIFAESMYQEIGEENISGSLNLVSQWNKYHEVKGGLSVNYHTIRRFGVIPGEYMESAEYYGGEKR